MKIKTKSKEGIVYQVESKLEDVGIVVIDICYSGYDDVFEFEYAHAYQEDNIGLTSEQLDAANDILECGFEEQIVLFLQDIYAELGVRFDVGDYKNNPTSILYCKK